MLWYSMSIWNKVKEGITKKHVAGILLGLAACMAYADNSGGSLMNINQLAPTAAIHQTSPSLVSPYALKNMNFNQVVDSIRGDGTHLLTLTKEVNEKFNRGIQYQSDQALYGMTDYYATTDEVLKNGAGDCEDYVTIKYATLIQKGVDPNLLKFTYVKTNMGESHMVLAVFDQDKDPLILDNMIGGVYRLSQRSDLKPVFSFNQFGGAIKMEKNAHEFEISQLSRADVLFKKLHQLGVTAYNNNTLVASVSP